MPNKKSKLIVVVGTYMAYKKWCKLHPRKAGKFIPHERRFTKTVLVHSEISAMKVLTLDNVEDLVILNKKICPILDMIQKKIAIVKLINR
jgi:hypothetical protein